MSCFTLFCFPSAGITKPCALTTTKKTVRDAGIFNGAFFETRTTPKNDWGVYDWQFYKRTAEHASVAATHYGMPEVRIAFEGDEYVLGIQVDKLPGSSIKQKRANMEAMEMSNMVTSEFEQSRGPMGQI